MPARDGIELLLLHALPLDGSMWAGQMDLVPGATHAPTLYSFGDNMAAWARGAIELVRGNRVIVVGCSVGGSCALEVAHAAPERVAAIVLIGTKARHDPDPALRAAALRTIQDFGLETGWVRYWQPLFSRATPPAQIEDAQRIAFRQAPSMIARGIEVFHGRSSRDSVLSSFPNPITIVSGADDVAPGPRTSAAQAALVRRGRLHIVPRCGHYVPIEQPQVMNAILRAAIEEQLV